MATVQPCVNKSNQPQPLDWPKAIVQDPVGDSFAAGVQRYARHPWRAIDYHMYLSAIEKNRDRHSRTTKTHLLTVNGFQKVSLDDLACPSSAFHQVPVWSTPILTFVSLPVLHALCEPSQRKLVLGFDFKKRHLIASYFSSAPDNLADMADLWEHGQTVIDIRIERFLEIVKYSMEKQMDIFGRGMFQHFGETKRQLPVGLDLVVVIQFLQFLDDFADLLWGDGAEFRDYYQAYEDSLRDALSQASVSAWFAIRDGLTIQQFCQRTMHEPIRSGLFFDQTEAPAPPSPQPESPSTVALRHLMEARGYMVSLGYVQQRLDLLTVLDVVHFFALFGRLIRFRG